MGDENPIRTLGDYSKPSHEGYKNTIKLPVGNNVIPFRSDTIRLVQNGRSFYELRSKDPNQHLKDFLKLVYSLDLNDENKERTCLRSLKEDCGLGIGVGKLTSTTLDVLQKFNFFFHTGLKDILATFEGLDKEDEVVKDGWTLLEKSQEML
nr:MAK10-like protein [Tanacetum cinerariifolium]